ncbi:copper oxidase [Bifidobacterium dolichotidis]|uniref:Copper oxidase n=1 Tax=Bifidobacterium dolichotidis TaxID=2306976 RepID=A0A430FQB5_9BIFI|nr:polyphenol oxidase family protein [Bifidobacterium dolichotidis]RSX55033.1 copper oxidase [Bifidobacterium dolichotidis]
MTEKHSNEQDQAAQDASRAISDAINDAIAKALKGQTKATAAPDHVVKQYDDAILDSTTVDATDSEGNPVPVTLPIALAPGITVVYTTRLGGVSQGDYAHFNLGGRGGDASEAVEANREALARELHAKFSIVHQVHGNEPIDIDEQFVENRPFGFDASGSIDGIVDDVEHVGNNVQIIDGDAQVTTKTDIALGVFAADCLPVALADPDAGVIAIAHCGRRGLEQHVITATVKAMIEKGADRNNIVATLGPAICGDCYEVGDEIADAFDHVFPGTYTLTRFGGAGIDLNAAALQELDAAGIRGDRIISSQPRANAATQYLSHDEELRELCKQDNEGDPELDERIGAIHRSLCTLENPLWFSHRRAQLAHKDHEGRMLALIVRH